MLAGPARQWAMVPASRLSILKSPRITLAGCLMQTQLPSGVRSFLLPRPAAVVHIVDDDPSVCTALGALVERAEASWQSHASGEEFLAVYDPALPSCLLLDIALPGINGLDLLAELEVRALMMPTLVLSANAEIERIVTAIQRGAVGFLQKPPEPRRFLEHLLAMIARAPGMVAQRQRTRQLRDAIGRLTPRERQVLQLLLAGRSPKQIALELGLSGRTAHIHRTNVLRKLRIETPLELVQLVGQLPEALTL